MKTPKAERHSKQAKAERRARRKAHDRRHDRDGLTIHPLGGTMDPDLLDSMVTAIRDFDPTGSWSDVAPRILPVLKRLRHPYPPDAAPLQMLVPPGIWTGFGVDLGPAFSHVTAGLVDDWGIDHATLLGTALENLTALTRIEPPRVEEIRPQDVKTVVVQGQGWGSSLVLTPEVLRPILGTAPLLLLTPVRNTLVALPEDVDLDFAIDIWQAIADGCHDELDVDPLRWTGTTVVAESSASAGRLH